MIVGYYFTEYDDINNDSEILIVLYMIKFPFYLIVIYYTFLTYRELKGIYIDYIQASIRAESHETARILDQNRNRTTLQGQNDPFEGTGYKLG